MISTTTRIRRAKLLTCSRLKQSASAICSKRCAIAGTRVSGISRLGLEAHATVTLIIAARVQKRAVPQTTEYVRIDLAYC